jgi:Zn-finger nucleic acid-binding protein
VSDEKDRLGQTLHHRGKVIEDSWARQHDEEIIAKLREKYSKPIKCPICGQQLDARVAVGLGGMACPLLHGAWLTTATLEAVRVRLANAEAAHHAGLGEKISQGIQEIVEGLHKIHPTEIDCPDCGARLEARAAEARGEAGLGGMVCPNRHGAWLDHATLEKIRGRLDMLEKHPTR